jgi:hypothetical protein
MWGREGLDRPSTPSNFHALRHSGFFGLEIQHTTFNLQYFIKLMIALSKEYFLMNYIE